MRIGIYTMRVRECIWILLLTTLIVSDADGMTLNPVGGDAVSKFVHSDGSNCSITHRCLDCSCRGLSKIPDLPQNITCLNLRGNNITTINGSALARYGNLTNLSLSDNYLRKIGKHDFVNLTSLENLDLSLNNISYDKIDKDAFNSLPKLVYLDLKQNSNLNQTTYPHSLVHLTGLTRLMIDGINRQVPDLPNLTELYLSGQYGSCNIPYIRGELFKGVPNIEYLYMSNCSVRGVENGAFQNLSHLNALDLSWNSDLTFGAIENITNSLHSVTFKRLNLNNVYKYYENDNCTVLTANVMRNLNATSVELLTVESNNIARLEEAAVKYIPKSLKYLSARDNILLYGKYTDVIIDQKIFQRLVYLDMSNMFRSHLKPYFNPYADGKCIQCDTEFTRDQIRTYFETIDERLAEFNISPIGSNSSSRNEYLDVSYMQFDVYPLMFNLTGNPAMLKYLNMSGIYLGYTLLDSSTIFDEFVNLKTLDLRTNAIIYLKRKTFDKITNIERLYLRDNKITNITFNIHLLHKLKYLDLKSNHLDLLDSYVMKSLDELPNITINIADNNLKCSCNQENLDFLRWVNNSHTKFEDFKQTACMLVDGTSKLLRDLNYDQFLYECQPPGFHNLILVTSLCILVFVFVVIGAIIYRYRWNLRYLYYMTKFKLAGGYRSLEEDDFERDVFVSYAEEDKAFVRDCVQPELEKTGDLSLLLHGRDFQAGEFVADNIMKAVTSTRKTLVILTRSYIQSKWCMYEMNMARLEGINANRNVLCVVLKDDIPTDHLPIEIIDIIRTQTYIEYPVNEENQSEFWQRLRATLR